jgi:hypothetical protein
MSDRKINLGLSSVTLSGIADTVGHEHLWKAIGYLSQWASGTYPNANIYSDGGCDLVAHYSDPDCGRQYTIGAVWHGDHYGFHS